MQPVVSCNDWTEVDETGRIRSLRPPYQPRFYSFSGVGEFKEADEKYITLSITVGAFTFCVIVAQADYERTGVLSGPFPIEVISLTCQGYIFWNIRWVILGDTQIEARVLHTS